MEYKIFREKYSLYYLLEYSDAENKKKFLNTYFYFKNIVRKNNLSGNVFLAGGFFRKFVNGECADDNTDVDLFINMENIIIENKVENLVSFIVELCSKDPILFFDVKSYLLFSNQNCRNGKKNIISGLISEKIKKKNSKKEKCSEFCYENEKRENRKDDIYSYCNIMDTLEKIIVISEKNDIFSKFFEKHENIIKKIKFLLEDEIENKEDIIRKTIKIFSANFFKYSSYSNFSVSTINIHLNSEKKDIFRKANIVLINKSFILEMFRIFCKRSKNIINLHDMDLSATKNLKLNKNFYFTYILHSFDDYSSKCGSDFDLFYFHENFISSIKNKEIKKVSSKNFFFDQMINFEGFGRKNNYMSNLDYLLRLTKLVIEGFEIKDKEIIDEITKENYLDSIMEKRKFLDSYRQGMIHSTFSCYLDLIKSETEKIFPIENESIEKKEIDFNYSKFFSKIFSNIDSEKEKYESYYEENSLTYNIEKIFSNFHDIFVSSLTYTKPKKVNDVILGKCCFRENYIEFLPLVFLNFMKNDFDIENTIRKNRKLHEKYENFGKKLNEYKNQMQVEKFFENNRGKTRNEFIRLENKVFIINEDFCYPLDLFLLSLLVGKEIANICYLQRDKKEKEDFMHCSLVNFIEKSFVIFKALNENLFCNDKNIYSNFFKFFNLMIYCFKNETIFKKKVTVKLNVDKLEITNAIEDYVKHEIQFGRSKKMPENFAEFILDYHPFIMEEDGILSLFCSYPIEEFAEYPEENFILSEHFREKEAIKYLLKKINIVI